MYTKIILTCAAAGAVCAAIPTFPPALQGLAYAVLGIMCGIAVTRILSKNRNGNYER